MAEKGSVKVTMLVVGPVQTNCYIVNREGSEGCVIVDPGDEPEKIAKHVREQGLTLEAILLTHGHFDHFEGVPGLTAELGGRVYILDEEKNLISDPYKNGSAGLMGKSTAIEPEFFVHDGEVLGVADMDFKVIHTPGHTSGGCCYYLEDAGLLFAGDTIFMESIGRTDLPTGNMAALLSSIREKVLTLPDDVKILPGHGPVTNVAYEIANNPYA